MCLIDMCEQMMALGEKLKASYETPEPPCRLCQLDAPCWVHRTTTQTQGETNAVPD